MRPGKAEFSEPDRGRRFSLTRDWSDEVPGPLRTVNFIMLNPSCADEDETDDDRTIKMCIERSRRWGGISRIVATNLIPIVQTHPELLPPWSGIDSENTEHLLRWMSEADLIVVGWGGPAKEIAQRIGLLKHIAALRGITPADVHCIGHTKTKERHPYHPSRGKYTEGPMLWQPGR
jgi:hypothetical protein